MSKLYFSGLKNAKIRQAKNTEIISNHSSLFFTGKFFSKREIKNIYLKMK